LQKALKNAPKSVVIDYKSAWEVGIKKVFPNTLIIRDGFHTVRLLNTAILKELMTISEPMFASVIRETKRLAALIKRDQWLGNGVKFAPQNPVIKEFK
jgi:transposase